MGSSGAAIVILASVLAATAAELYPLSDDFIGHINSKQSSWKAGRNFPHNTPLKYLKQLLGVLPSKRGNPLPRVKHDADLIASLPETFDSRVKWPNCPSLNEIRDQGSCGSCWAFAAVEAMTDRVCIHSNATKQFHFSAEDLMTCCTDCGSGCHGGYSEEAWVYWEENGIVSGGNYNTSQGCRPYSTSPCVHHAPGININATEDLKPCLNEYRDTPKCIKTCDKNYRVPYEKDKLYARNSYTIYDEGEEHIMAELFMYGPVQASFMVYLDFFNYKSGVYYTDESKQDYLGGHAIKIIGWGVEEGTKYWLVANSWNTGWGDNGFFKIRRGMNDCFIETTVVAGEPLLTEG